MLGEAEADGLWDGDVLPGAALGEIEELGLWDGEADGLALGETEADGLCEGLADGETEAEGL